MRFWPKKDDPIARVNEIVSILNSINLQVGHEVTVEHKPRPIQPPPTSIVFTMVNGFGEQWVLHPMHIHGQSTDSVNIPKNFITGDIGDSGKEFRLQARLYYQ